jgi:hypothetical protein
MSKNQKGKEEPEKPHFSTASHHNAFIFQNEVKNNVSMYFSGKNYGIFLMRHIKRHGIKFIPRFFLILLQLL